ncbi:MAG: hypothetical protein CMJ52_09995 [Planctomycetaceae bacterium]|nr:hypothetical protein [Planctomycetaceae bacterium]
MRLCTILDTTTARSVGIPDAVCDLVVPHGAPVDAIASILPGNPLADDWVGLLDLPGDLLVAWSGTLADELFADDPRTWMAEGHERFEAFCDDIRESLVAAGRRLCFRPHGRHVLSDPQGTLDFLRRRADEPFGLALSPADLLLPSMLPDAEDHYTRILDFMMPKADLLFLADAVPGEPVDEYEEPPMLPVPLGEGVLPRAAVMEAVHTRLPEGVPVVVAPRDLPTATAWRHGAAR